MTTVTWTGKPSFCLLPWAKYPTATCTLASLNDIECVGNTNGLCVFWFYLYELPFCSIHCLYFTLSMVRKEAVLSLGRTLVLLPFCLFLLMTPVIVTLTSRLAPGDFVSITVETGCCFMAGSLICLLDWLTSNECPSGLLARPGGRNTGFPEPRGFESLSSP